MWWLQVEADSYWCLTKLLDGIQENYIAAQPGIQRKVQTLRELVNRIDKPLDEHLSSNMVEYLQFSFRWMNCLLMRELPLKSSTTYHHELPPINYSWDPNHSVATALRTS